MRSRFVLRAAAMVGILSIVLASNAAVAADNSVQVEPAKVLIKAPFFEGGYGLPSISPDGKLMVATNRQTGRVRVFDLATGDIVSRPQNAERLPASVVFLTNEKLAVFWIRSSRPEDHVLADVTIHNAQTGATLHNLKPNVQPGEMQITTAASPDGTRLVTRATATEVWNADTGERLYEIADEGLGPWPEGEEVIDRTQVSGDGKLLLLSRGTGKWRRFDMATGEPIGEALSASTPGEVAFSPDGQFVSVGGGATIQLLDAADGKSIIPAEAEPDAAPAAGRRKFGVSAFSPDGKRLVIQRDARIIIHDIEVLPPRPLFEFKIDSVRHHTFRWTPDGKRLFCSAGSWMGDFNITKRRQTTADLPHSISIFSVDFMLDGRELLTADIAGKLIRWSMPEGKIVATRPEPQVPNDLRIVNTANYLTDGKRILTEGQLGTFTWMDRETFKPLATHRQVFPRSSLSRFIFPRDGSAIAFWSTEEPAGARLVITTPPQSTGVLETPNLYPRAFTADGKTLIVSKENVAMRVDVMTRKILPGSWTRPLGPRREPIGTLTASPDGRWLIETGLEALTAWRLDRPTESAAAWTLKMSTTHRPIFSPSGALAFVVETGGVRIIELQSGQTVAYLSQPDAMARIAEPMPGSSMLLVVSAARHVVLYDLATVFSKAADPKGDLPQRTPDELWELAGRKSAADSYAALAELHKRGQLAALAGDAARQVATAREKSARARKLISQLDDADPKVRENAHLGLERMGNPAAAELRLATTGATGEKAERLTALLRLVSDDNAEPAAPQPAGLRMERVLEVMSWSAASDDAATKPTTAPTKPAG